MIRAIFYILFFFHSGAWATEIQGSITLINDSPYILTASVYTHSGDFLGQETLQAGEQKNFTTNLSSITLKRPGRPDVSITPYRIIWTCAGGGVFSMCQIGAAGSTVRASDCAGLQYCTPKEKPQEISPKKKQSH